MLYCGDGGGGGGGGGEGGGSGSRQQWRLLRALEEVYDTLVG